MPRSRILALTLLPALSCAAFAQLTIDADSDEVYYVFFKVFAEHDAHLHELGASGSAARNRAEQTFARTSAAGVNIQLDQNRAAWANDMKRYAAQGAAVNAVERDQVGASMRRDRV